jgi:hypothetical protein
MEQKYSLSKLHLSELSNALASFWFGLRNGGYSEDCHSPLMSIFIGGPYRISNKMLNEINYEIAGSLYFLFSKSLRDNIFPAD